MSSTSSQAQPHPRAAWETPSSPTRTREQPCPQRSKGDRRELASRCDPSRRWTHRRLIRYPPGHTGGPLMARAMNAVPSSAGSSPSRTISAADRPTRRPMLRLVGLASITVSFLAASSAPTPLYATYQAAWGFSSLTTTVVFGVYAVALLATLLIAGRLSDYVGRRPVLLAGIAGQVLAVLIFADAQSVAALLAARIVQGLATG